MGAYFRVVNLDRREWLDPNDFGDNADKLGGILRGPLGTMLAELLASTKEWSGQRIALVSDEWDTPGAPSYHDLDDNPEWTRRKPV